MSAVREAESPMHPALRHLVAALAHLAHPSGVSEGHQKKDSKGSKGAEESTPSKGTAEMKTPTWERTEGMQETPETREVAAALQVAALLEVAAWPQKRWVPTAEYEVVRRAVRCQPVDRSEGR